MGQRSALRITLSLLVGCSTDPPDTSTHPPRAASCASGPVTWEVLSFTEITCFAVTNLQILTLRRLRPLLIACSDLSCGASAASITSQLTHRSCTAPYMHKGICICTYVSSYYYICVLVLLHVHVADVAVAPVYDASHQAYVLLYV